MTELDENESFIMKTFLQSALVLSYRKRWLQFSVVGLSEHRLGMNLNIFRKKGTIYIQTKVRRRNTTKSTLETGTKASVHSKEDEDVVDEM